MTELENKDHIIKSYGKMADDFFYSLLLTKSSDIGNDTIPFLYAHILELSVKTYCIKNDINYSDISGHKIIDIYKRIAKISPELNHLLPKPLDFNDYKKFWSPGNIKVPNVKLLTEGSDNFDILELAYIIDNVMDLKYGFRKNFTQVSIVSVTYTEINKRFLDLFNFCRDSYKTDELNKNIKLKIFNLYGHTPELETKLKNLINV